MPFRVTGISRILNFSIKTGFQKLAPGWRSGHFLIFARSKKNKKTRITQSLAAENCFSCSRYPRPAHFYHRNLAPLVVPAQSTIFLFEQLLKYRSIERPMLFYFFQKTFLSLDVFNWRSAQIFQRFLIFRITIYSLVSFVFFYSNYSTVQATLTLSRIRQIKTINLIKAQ